MDNSKYVLFVDDDQDICEIVMEAFKLLSINAKCACSGEEALDKLKESEKLPGIVLLDLMMPKTDGRWFCEERMKISRLRDIPVVILSADNKAAEKTADLHVNGVLRKPIKIDELKNTVLPYLQ